MISAITPYRINIVQGNFVSKEAYDQLKPGMTRNQVRLLLGTPLLTDMFHDNRWDYVFYFKRGSTSVVQERRLSVYFDGDHLARWTGGENLPSEQELVREIDGQKGKISKPSKPAANPQEAASPAPASAAGTAEAVAAPEAASSPAAALPGAASSPEAQTPAPTAAPPATAPLAPAPATQAQNASQGSPVSTQPAADAPPPAQLTPADSGGTSLAPAAPVPSQPITSPGGLFTLPSQ